MKCIIVDDEPIARRVIENYLSKVDGFEVTKSFGSANQVFNHLRQFRVDIMFLDINMPGLSGLNLLRTLQHPPQTIITTAYPDYALEGFELRVADYLVKPISYERFLQALGGVSLTPGIGYTDHNLPSRDFIFLLTQKKLVKVNLAEILYIQGLSNYVRVKIRNKNEIITYQKLHELEKLLPAGQFLRIHRSYIVSVSAIEAIKKNSIEMEGMELPIGGHYKEAIMQTLLGEEKSGK